MVGTTAVAPLALGVDDVGTRPRAATMYGRIGLVGHLRTLRRWAAATRGHGVWIAIWSLIGWAGTFAAPFLADDRPFLLMLMAPRALFVALAANSVDLMTFVLLGTVRLGITDANYFILGRRFERAGPVPPRRRSATVWGRFRMRALALTDACCRWLCNHGVKAGTVLFFRPNGKYLAVAGAYGVSARVAGFASVLGTAIYLAGFHLGFGLLL